MKQCQKPNNQRSTRNNIRKTYSDVHPTLIILESAPANPNTCPRCRISRSTDPYIFY